MTKLHMVFLCLLLLVGILVGCNRQTSGESENSEQPPIGSVVTIQFRRDALGAATSNPVPPTTGSYNGAKVFIGGTLSKINKDWVVIQNAGKDVWIPKNVILLMRVE